MRTRIVAGLRLLNGLLLMLLALACFSAENGHVFQNIVDCEYNREDFSDMFYQVKLVFNQKLLCDYDSQRGKWKMAARKVELETVCKANARYYVNTTTKDYSSSLDNKIYKLKVGITSLILGLTVTVAGTFYYYWRTHGGGGSGIGRAVCQRFASEGASVVVADRNKELAHKTLKLLSRDCKGQEHVALEVDVSLKESVENLVNTIQSHYFQPPSICVTAAGITQDEFLLKMEEEDFDKVIRVNLKGTFLLIQRVSKALVAAGVSKGSIITVGSIVGKVGNVGQINYSASKAGVEGLTWTAAKELSRYGIRCNCILPGFIASPMTENVPDKVMSKITPLILMGRMGKPAEVADVCAFLASDDSQYITGVGIEVAGGLFIG